MRSMKVALRSVGIQLSPQEMCEALQQADLDGDGIVSFKDFLGVLTDNHRLTQCMGPALRATSSSASSRVPAPGARSPYSQIPNLEGRTPPERRTRSRASGPDVRLPKPYQ
ncbi:EF-hand calcium-binding domain-containing protein 3-like, partial [Daubentonia madagascariensis]